MSGNPASRTPGDVPRLTIIGTGEYVCEGDACSAPVPEQAATAGFSVETAATVDSSPDSSRASR